MGGFLAALAGAAIIGGVVLGVWAWTPRPVGPPRPARVWHGPGWWAGLRRWQRAGALVAVAVGVVAGLTTGWWLAVPVLPAAVIGLPAVLLAGDDGAAVRRADAIAEWARSLAGVLTAGQGLEGALAASVRSAPEAIRPEVSRLVVRLRSRWSTEDALQAFADELDDATGDLVVGSLKRGAARRGDGLSLVLTGLAESVSEDVRVRREIARKQAEPRSTARTVTLITAGALVFFSLTGTFLAPYSTPFGQVVLGVLLAAYAAALALLQRMSKTPRVPRVLVRTEQT